MGTPAGDLRSTIERRIAAHDRDGAVASAIEAVRTGTVEIASLYDELCALLVGVGDAWQRGETEVWEEHFATATVRTIVEACHPFVLERAAAPSGRVVVLAAPPEEYHDLGLRMVADRFTLAGWTAHLLGASVPLDELIAATTELKADAVVLSASTHFHRLGLREYIEGLRAAVPDVRIWVGGAAFAREADDWASELILDVQSISSLDPKVG